MSQGRLAGRPHGWRKSALSVAVTPEQPGAKRVSQSSPQPSLLTILQALVGDPGDQAGVGPQGSWGGRKQQPQQQRGQDPGRGPHPGVGGWAGLRSAGGAQLPYVAAALAGAAPVWGQVPGIRAGGGGTRPGTCLRHSWGHGSDLGAGCCCTRVRG